jgi:signal transduction histidine kinase
LISFYVAFLFLQPKPAFGQNKYVLQHYTNENGLQANGITGIELDKKNGFLWVATQAGLLRFDGKYFKSFGSAENRIAASRTNSITKNREGTIYCEDDNFSIYRITDNKPRFVVTDPFFKDGFVLRGPDVQANSEQRVVKKFRHEARSVFLPGWIIFHEESGDSSSFSFLNFGQPYHYNAARDTLLCLSASRNFKGMLKIDGRIYFFGDNPDLWEYNDSLMKLLPAPVTDMPRWNEQGQKPQYIWQQGMKEPLLIYKGSIWKLQRSGNIIRTQLLCRECCPADVLITGAQIWEEQGIIFLSSTVNGLYVVRRPFLQSIVTDANAKGKAEYGQAEIIPGLITTSSGRSFSPQGNLIPGKTMLEFQEYVIYQNKEGDCWFRSKDTIFHFYPKTGRYVKIAVSSGAYKIAFAETRNHVYLISDFNIAEITGDQYRVIYKLPHNANELKNTFNPDVAIEWKRGVLAIAGEKPLLFDTEKRTLDSILMPGLTTKVRGLLKYKDYLLIGTYGQGFYMYKNGIVKKMPLDKNQYLSYTHCFVPDDKGFCWISTNHGLFKVSMNALITAYQNDLNEIYYQYFGKDDGIINTEFNGGCQPCALKLSNGLFSFPNMKGLAIFDPLTQQPLPPAGQIFIDEVLADDRTYQINDSALNTLPYGLRNLRFNLALPLFGNQENIYFSYKLEPYSSEWEKQDITQNNILQFGGLKPGNYKLYLRVRNGFEPDQFGITMVEFRILKPWYQNWGFYLLCILSFIAMIWAFVKWRTIRIIKKKEELQQLVNKQTKDIEAQSKQLENQLSRLQNQQIKLEEDNKVKGRLIGIISHDIITPLKFIDYLGKKLRNAFTISDPAYQTAESMVSATQELESLSTNILNWISFHHEASKMEPEQFNLHELVNESTKIAARLAVEKNVKLYNDIPEATVISQYKQIISIIVYNLTMNAIKHTEKGEIRIAEQTVNHYLSLSITDTGSGMSPELAERLNAEGSGISGYSNDQTKKYQFGYVIIKDLLHLVNGTMKIESELNKGTRVIIQFSTQTRPNDGHTSGIIS